MVTKPEAIPQFTGNVDAIEKYAGTLKTVGVQFRDIGADTHNTWQGLSAFYEAPEADKLFAATAPIKSTADTFGGKVKSVGSALSQYASTIRPIVDKLKLLKSEAICFAGMVNADEDWREDEDKVNRNNDLIRQVDAQVAALMAAERAAANRINALYGGTQWTVDDGSSAANMYGFNAGDIPLEADRPWGSSAEVDEPWYVDTWNAVWSAGKGIVVDGLWGTVTGIWGLINPFDWDTFSNSWVGIWTLTGGVFVDPGKTGNAWKELGKSFIAWDEWKKDPARAVGVVAFNVLTLPFVAAKIGKVGPIAKVNANLARAAEATKLSKIADLANAGKLAGLLKLDKIGLPTVGDLAKQINGVFKDALARDPGLDAAFRNADDLAARADKQIPHGDDIIGPADEGAKARRPELVGTDGRGIDEAVDSGISGTRHGVTDGYADGVDGTDTDGPASTHHQSTNDRAGSDPVSRPSDDVPHRTPERGTPEYETRQDELAKDPAHGGRIKPKTLREAEVGLEMERRGELPGPIRRAPLETDAHGRTVDRGEFVDAEGTHWDVKTPADIFPRGPQAGQPMPPSLRGRYDGEEFAEDIADELSKGQNVIIDSKDLSATSLADLKQRVAANPEWRDRVRFF